MQKQRGRTVWEILVGSNKPDTTPLELKYYNPLKAKLGMSVTMEFEDNLSGINFFIEKIAVYKTITNGKEYLHTDYVLKGVTLDAPKPLRVLLRLVKHEDSLNKLGCDLQVLQVMDEFPWDEGFYENVLCNDARQFRVERDDAGNELREPIVYWRVDNVPDPYRADVTILSDQDGDGKVAEEELTRYSTTYWDYHREMDKSTALEYVWVEMDETKHFVLYRGTQVTADQIMVI